MPDPVNDSKDRQDKPGLGAELIIPVASVLFSLYYFSTITDVPWTAQVSAFFVGSILGVLSLVFIVRSILRVRRGEATFGLGRLLEPVAYVPKRIVLFLLTIGYIFVIQWLGFTITTFLFLSSAMLLLGEGKKKGLIFCLSLVLSFGGYLLFVVAFETRFPEGPFELMVKGLF